jgi:hypothetical protein
MLLHSSEVPGVLVSAERAVVGQEDRQFHPCRLQE